MDADQVEQLESQRASLLAGKRQLAEIEREAFAAHAKLEEDQLAYVK